METQTMNHDGLFSISLSFAFLNIIVMKLQFLSRNCQIKLSFIDSFTPFSKLSLWKYIKIKHLYL